MDTNGDEEEFDQQTDKENELPEESEEEQQPICDDEDEDCFRQAMHSDSDDSCRDSRRALLFDEKKGYKNVKFALHQKFRDASVFRMALQAYSVEHGFEYLLKRNEKCKISVICKASGCRFYLYASQNPRNEYMEIRHFFEEHDCRTPRKACITSQYLAVRYLDLIRANLTMSPKSLRKLVQLDLQLVPTLSKCYRAIRKAQEVINGDLYKQFDCWYVPTNYATNTFKAICAPLVKPVGSPHEWEKSSKEPMKPPVILPLKKRMKGRNELKTLVNNPYKAGRDVAEPLCGHCRKKGHNKRTCPELNKSGSTPTRKEKNNLHMRKKRAEQRAKSSEYFQDNVEPSTSALQRKGKNTVNDPERERKERSREIALSRLKRRAGVIPCNDAATVQEPQVGGGTTRIIPAVGIAQAELDVLRSTPMDKKGPNDEIGSKILNIHHGREQDRSEEEQILECDVTDHNNGDSDEESDGNEEEYDQQTDRESELPEESEEEQQPISEVRFDEERECDDDCFRLVMHSGSDDSCRDNRTALLFDEKNGYKNVKFALHQRFRNASVFRMALQAYAVEHGFGYLLKRNEKCKISVICTASGCRFYLYASQNPRNNYMEIRHFFEEHDCRTSRKTCITSQYLAIRYLDQIRASPTMSPKSLQELVQLDLQLVLTPSKCYRAIKRAHEVINGELYKQLDWLHVPTYYATNTFKAICAPLVNPAGGPMNPPVILRPPGRNELKTSANNPYKAGRDVTEPLCGHCRKKGHNKRTCPELNKSGSTETRKEKKKLHMRKKRAEERAKSSDDSQDNAEPSSTPAPQRKRKSTVNGPERERMEQSREIALSRLRKRRKPAELIPCIAAAVQKPQVGGGTSTIPAVGIAQAELDISRSTQHALVSGRQPQRMVFGPCLDAVPVSKHTSLVLFGA